MKITKNTDLSNTHTSVEETDNRNSGKLSEELRIGNSPFTALRFDEDWHIACGSYRIPQKFREYLECVEYVENNLWEMLGMFVTVMVEEKDKLKNNN